MKEKYLRNTALAGCIGVLGFAGFKVYEDSKEYDTPNGLRGPGYEISVINGNRLEVRSFSSWAILAGDPAARSQIRLEQIIDQCGPVLLEKSKAKSLFNIKNGRINEIEFVARVENADKCIKGFK